MKDIEITRYEIWRRNEMANIGHAILVIGLGTLGYLGLNFAALVLLGLLYMLAVEA